MYGAEFAEIYELVYAHRGKDFRQETKDAAELIRARAPLAGTLLDVGCGTGAHLARFAELFDQVAGVELSAPMVAAANARLPAGVVHQGDMRDFDLGRTFDAITCLFATIGYAHTQAELVATLRRFHAHLTPGGVAVVDPWWFPDTFTAGHVAGDVASADGRTVARVSHAARDGDKSRMTVHYVIADADDGVRHVAETYLARLCTRAQYESAFRQAGFTPEYLPGRWSGRGLFVAVRDRRAP